MKRTLRFALNQQQSPTHYNLCRYLQKRGWQASFFPWQRHFSDKNLQFNQAAAEQLEYKHLLARLVKQFCPEIMPLTYCINDNNWLNVLEKIADAHQDELVWILKPALLNNGKEIKIFQTLGQIEQHYLSSNRLGGEHVLQQYLDPHLLRGEHKYSIRLFVVTTNYAKSFLYPYGYYNVAKEPYQATSFSDLKPHLTNEHLDDNEANVIQIPTARFESFVLLYPHIKAMVTAVFQGLEQWFPEAFVCNASRVLAIYGFDFIVDAAGCPWLLEANHGPCFPISESHSLQHYLYEDFWQALITSFIEPIARNTPVNDIVYESFEKIHTS